MKYWVFQPPEVRGLKSLPIAAELRMRKSRVRGGKIKRGGSEPPVHDGACKAVSCLDVDLGDGQVPLDHVER